MNFDPEHPEIGSEDSDEQKPATTIEARIGESLEKIRPYLNSEGGDVEFIAFDDKTGIVQVRLQGACSHCAISTVTLKVGIERSLMEDIPEVKGVVQI